MVNPENTFFVIKLLISRWFKYAKVQQDISYLAYKIDWWDSSMERLSKEKMLKRTATKLWCKNGSFICQIKYRCMNGDYGTSYYKGTVNFEDFIKFKHLYNLFINY